VGELYVDLLAMHSIPLLKSHDDAMHEANESPTISTHHE